MFFFVFFLWKKTKIILVQWMYVSAKRSRLFNANLFPSTLCFTNYKHLVGLSRVVFSPRMIYIYIYMYIYLKHSIKSFSPCMRYLIRMEVRLSLNSSMKLLDPQTDEFNMPRLGDITNARPQLCYFISRQSIVYFFSFIAPFYYYHNVVVMCYDYHVLISCMSLLISCRTRSCFQRTWWSQRFLWLFFVRGFKLSYIIVSLLIL